MVEFALQDPQARVGQVAGVAPAEQFLALRADDGPARPQRGGDYMISSPLLAADSSVYDQFGERGAHTSND